MWKSYHHLLPTHSLNYLKSFWKAGVFWKHINHYNSLDQQITASYIVHTLRVLPNDILVNYKPPKYRICMYIFLIHRICIVIYDIRYTIHDIRYCIHNSNEELPIFVLPQLMSCPSCFRPPAAIGVWSLGMMDTCTHRPSFLAEFPHPFLLKPCSLKFHQPPMPAAYAQ